MMVSCPGKYFLSTSGIITEPSACWNCSKIAGNKRLVANPEAFKVFNEYFSIDKDFAYAWNRKICSSENFKLID